MSDGFIDPYLYLGTQVLRNKLDIRDADELDRAERNLVRTRNREGVPRGNFDLAHLKAIHHHLFQDVYDWAGQVRTLEISKGPSSFMFRQFIESGMADVHSRLVKSRFLSGLGRDDFAREAGKIIGDVNHIHPFREGNGRTQALYLKQLSAQAGHPLDLTQIGRKAWIEASIAANRADYDLMGEAIRKALERDERAKTMDDYWNQKAKERAPEKQPKRDKDRDRNR